MEIKRFFAQKADVADNTVTLRGDEFYHAVKVLRHKVGFKIIVCTGENIDICATIVEIGSDFLTAKIDKIEPNCTETQKELTLFQCVAKEMDFIIQKAVELGVKKLVPVMSHFVNAAPHLERWKKIVVESSKQCGRASLMQLSEPIDFSSAVNLAKTSEHVLLFPYERATAGNIATSVQNAQKIGLFVGCEGGFSAEEAQELKEEGACTVTLGKRILRAETAAIVAIALALSAAGELE